MKQKLPMKNIQIVIVVLALAICIRHSVLAQETNGLTGTGVAISIPVSEKVQDGDIIVARDSGYKLGSEPYQATIYGVITDNPAVFLENGDSAITGTTYPVLISGKAFVRVSSANGPIKKNDLLTTSSVKGVGQKATVNGFVVGTALEDYTENDPKKIGKILVYIDPHFSADFLGVRENILQNLKNIAASPTLAPLTTLRYLLAALIAAASFIIGFVHFGRIVRTGIEALGRNPLATVFIQVSVLLNVGLTIGIILVGLGISYLILAL